VAVTVVLLTFLWPAGFGGSTHLVVVSGSSMEPTYHTGDLVVVRERRPEVGDVIAFRIPGREGQIVHRVLERRSDGTLLVQGDNRRSPDLPVPTDADVMGVASLLVPRGAVVVQLLTSPLVLGVAVASWIVASGVGRQRREIATARRRRALTGH
jgi:signal peptidase I